MRRIFLVAVLAVLGLITILIFGRPDLKFSSDSSSNTPTLTQPSGISAVEQPIISLSFDFGNGQKIFSTFKVETPTGSVGATFKEGESLFELIQKTDLKIETEDFPPIGKIIVSINGFKSGPGGKYWQYWINGEYAQIGASAYIPKPGDQIEWKLTGEKPN